MARPRLVVLLPVRNGERLLPGWLDSVESMADSVVALADGSTDGTRRLLRASPLVHRLIVNPPRSGYVGWDDRANRQALLGAAIDLVLNLLAQASRVGVLITRARAEGRDSLSEAEVDELAAENSQARDQLQEAIDRARAEGR